MSNTDQQKRIENILASVERIKNKESSIYFLVQDTKGNPKGSVAYMYELCAMLIEGGYKASILHEQEYKGVASWLGDEYAKLPHTVNTSSLAIGPSDMIIIPEILGYVMQQLLKVSCIKVVLAQAYDHIFETLEAGMSWADFRFDRCITVSDSIHDFIHSFFPTVKVDTVNPFISSEFTKLTLPQKPIVAIHTRDQRDAIKTIKAFYAKYPQYRFVTFRDLRGVSRAEFAHSLKECCLSVWIDDEASFGTFPLESMQTGVPVIGKIPQRIPEWMGDNGIWVSDNYTIIDRVSDYLQSWLEDNVPEELYVEMDKTVAKYSREKTKKQIIKTIGNYLDKRVEALEEALTKIKEEATQ